MNGKGFVIQEPVILEEAEKVLNAFYEYKSKEGIYIYILGNLEIKDIKIPLEVKEKTNFEELLTKALNEAVLQVNKCTQQELQEIIMNIER